MMEKIPSTSINLFKNPQFDFSKKKLLNKQHTTLKKFTNGTDNP
jgi:hypothetical protein